MAETKPRREQIKEMIDTGNFTKKEIATEIGIKDSGVSSQLTYLRWMGNFIIWDKDKKLSFTDEEGFLAWQDANKAGRKTKSVSRRTPQEAYEATMKTISSQNKQLTKFENKVELLKAEPSDDDTLLPEAEAQIVLLNIKLQRNEAKLAEIDMTKVADEEVEEVVDADEEEELL